ncbi:MAG: hypothetical protein ACTS4Z_00265 [Candidatus Hodgkinia cicadicola]
MITLIWKIEVDELRSFEVNGRLQPKVAEGRKPQRMITADNSCGYVKLARARDCLTSLLPPKGFRRTSRTLLTGGNDCIPPRKVLH